MCAAQLSIDFSKNCNDENTKFSMTAAELDGLPASVLEGLKQVPDDGSGVTKYPSPRNYIPSSQTAI